MRANSGKIKMFTGRILSDKKHIFTTLPYRVQWKKMYIATTWIIHFIEDKNVNEKTGTTF
jgi:hypothetical protein